VDVIAVGRDGSSPSLEILDGVNVIRLQPKTRAHSKIQQLLGAARFLIMASLTIARNHLNRRYDLIHVHNMPDFLVFSAWLPRLTGTAIILDIHDICPEFYESKFHAGDRSPAVRLLKLGGTSGVELCQSRHYLQSSLATHRDVPLRVFERLFSVHQFRGYRSVSSSGADAES